MEKTVFVIVTSMPRKEKHDSIKRIFFSVPPQAGPKLVLTLYPILLDLTARHAHLRREEQGVLEILQLYRQQECAYE
jgi:hypothetical protein